MDPRCVSIPSSGICGSIRLGLARQVFAFVRRPMPPASVKKTVFKKPRVEVSFAPLTPAARNRIIGMCLAEAPREMMRDKFRKTDGQNPSLREVDDIIANLEANPDWDGSKRHKRIRPSVLWSATSASSW